MEQQLKIDFEKFVKSTNFSKKNIELKRDSFDHFIKNGFPNKRDENWRFSDLNRIISTNIKNLSFYANLSKSNKIDQSSYINNLQHNKIILINGTIEKIDFNHEDKNKIEIIDNLELQIEKKKINSLVSLNNAFVNKGCKLIIKKNYQLKKPFVVYNFTNKDLISKNINVRFDIVLEENSSLKLIDFFYDKSKNNFINIFYNIHVCKNSVFKNYKIDKNSNSNLKYFYNNVNQETNSLSEIFVLSSGSDFLKNEINCNLNGRHASVFINGIFNIEKKKHHEIKTNINHLIENTKSYQLIKGILKDNSKAVFQGKIFVDAKAQKTDGYQLSKAIQ